MVKEAAEVVVVVDVAPLDASFSFGFKGVYGFTWKENKIKKIVAEGKIINAVHK